METFRAFRIHSQAGGDDARVERITLDDLSDGGWSFAVSTPASTTRTRWPGPAKAASCAATRWWGRGRGRHRGRVRRPAGAGRRSGGRQRLRPERDPRRRLRRVRSRPGRLVVPLPAGLDTRTAMGLGTAGFTAALAIHRMELNGQHPELGPVAVTGATGGVGSLAIDMLSGLGYSVTAITSKADATDYLQALGASEIMNLKTDGTGRQAAGKSRVGRRGGQPGRATCWAGSRARSARRQHREHRPGRRHCTEYHGHAVYPPRREPARHQLRGRRRETCASPCGSALRPSYGLATSTQVATREVGLDELPAQFPAYIAGTVTGRTIVRLQ